MKNQSAASLTGFCHSLYLLQEISHIEEVCYEVSVLTVDNVLPLVAYVRELCEKEIKLSCTFGVLSTSSINLKY